jgi:membrane associated rhomboid family serine protease
MSFGPRLTPGVKGLLAALGVFTVGPALLGWVNPELARRIVEEIVFIPGELFRGHVWTPFTFSFVAHDPLDLLITALLMWMFGATLEQRWGTKRFLAFYFGSMAVVAVLTALVGLAAHEVAAYPYAGNWPAQEALVAAYSVLMPDAMILLAFVIPVAGRWLVIISAATTVLFVIMTRSPVPYVPHLFGLATGMALARGVRGPRHLWLRLRVWWIERRLANRRLRVVPGGERRPKDGSDGWLH